MVSVFCVLSKKSLPIPRLQKKSIYDFFSKLIILILHLGLWSIDLYLLRHVDRSSLFSHNSYPFSFPASLVKRLHFQHRINLAPLSKNQLTVYVWLYFCALICLSILKPIPQCLDYWTFILDLEIRLYNVSSIFLFQIILAILGSSHSDTNFRITCQFIRKPSGFMTRL